MLGGNYGLLSRVSYKPNPDYYIAQLWHDLMGSTVMAVDVAANGTQSQGTRTLRGYAHCTPSSRHADTAADTGAGVSLALVNIDRSATFHANVTAFGGRVLGSTRNMCVTPLDECAKGVGEGA